MWAVYCNGRFIGIKESNYAFASVYWAQRSLIREMRFTLEWED